MRQSLPEVLVPELPESPAERVLFLEREGIVVNPRPSVLDSHRNQNYRDASHLTDASDTSAFLKQLDMTLTAFHLSEENFERVYALLQKTNQFNVTQWRPSRQELLDFTASHGHVDAFELIDRNGSLGIVAVTAIDLQGSTSHLTNWVMSCRAFGRGVEWAVAEYLRDSFEGDLHKEWRVQPKVTERNRPGIQCLSDVGFVSTEGLGMTAVGLHIPVHHLRVEKGDLSNG